MGLAQLLEPIPEPAVANPLANLAKSEIWPADPLGKSRDSQLAAAENVISATPTRVSESLQLAAIIEQAELLRNPKPVELPLRLSASKIVQLLTEPDAFWAQIARPLPVSFSEAAARGTQFHERLEEAFELEADLDISDWQEQDRELGQAFLDSRFESLKPIYVEQALEFELGVQVAVAQLAHVNNKRLPDRVQIVGDGFRPMHILKSTLPMNHLIWRWHLDGNELEVWVGFAKHAVLVRQFHALHTQAQQR